MAPSESMRQNVDRDHAVMHEDATVYFVYEQEPAVRRVQTLIPSAGLMCF